MKPRKVFKVGQGHLGGALGPDSVHKLLPRVEKMSGKDWLEGARELFRR